MPTVHRQIADAARLARDHASARLQAARLSDAGPAELDMLADYADDTRDRWLRAIDADTSAILAGLDFDGPTA